MAATSATNCRERRAQPDGDRRRSTTTAITPFGRLAVATAANTPASHQRRWSTASTAQIRRGQVERVGVAEDEAQAPGASAITQGVDVAAPCAEMLRFARSRAPAIAHECAGPGQPGERDRRRQTRAA